MTGIIILAVLFFLLLERAFPASSHVRLSERSWLTHSGEDILGFFPMPTLW